jgi:conjugative relaxase-like TrwC/TraI family protein
MDYAEQHFAITRVRDKGKVVEVKTGNLVYAKTVHGTSRSGDPQRHTHVVVANATVEPKTGKVRALESLQIFKHTKLLGRVYRAELAKEALALGYDIRHDAKTGAFELADFSKDQLRVFSKRREQIEAATILAEQKKGGPLTAGQRDALALKDRPSKLKTPRSDLEERHRTRSLALLRHGAIWLEAIGFLKILTGLNQPINDWINMPDQQSLTACRFSISKRQSSRAMR